MPEISDASLMKKRICLYSLLLIIFIFLTGCGQSEKTSGNIDNSNIKQVKTEIAKMAAVSDTNELSATLEPMNEAVLSFEVSGRIISMDKRESDNVNKGDIIARVDSSQYQINTGIADASLAQAGANLSQVMNGSREQEKESAKAAYDKAAAVYQKALEDYNRMKALYDEGGVSKYEYENAQTNLTASQSDMESAKAAYDMAEQGARTETKQAAQAGYQLAEENSNQAKLALDKTVLRAPFKGTILDKLASDGQLVAQNTPVVRLGNIDSLKLVLPVPDNSIDNWKKGDKVIVSLYDKEKQGIVTNIFSATNQMTGTIGVEVTVQNNNHEWVPGQVAICSHITQSQKSIFLPVESMVSLDGKNPYVFIDVKGKAVKKEIKVGELKNNKIQILSGVNEGDEVIVSGANELFDGASIKITGGGDQ